MLEDTDSELNEHVTHHHLNFDDTVWLETIIAQSSSLVERLMTIMTPEQKATANVKVIHLTQLLFFSYIAAFQLYNNYDSNELYAAAEMCQRQLISNNVIHQTEGTQPWQMQ